MGNCASTTLACCNSTQAGLRSVGVEVNISVPTLTNDHIEVLFGEVAKQVVNYTPRFFFSVMKLLVEQGETIKPAKLVKKAIEYADAEDFTYKSPLRIKTAEQKAEEAEEEKNPKKKSAKDKAAKAAVTMGKELVSGAAEEYLGFAAEFPDDGPEFTFENVIEACIGASPVEMLKEQLLALMSVPAFIGKPLINASIRPVLKKILKKVLQRCVKRVTTIFLRMQKAKKTPDEMMVIVKSWSITDYITSKYSEMADEKEDEDAPADVQDTGDDAKQSPVEAGSEPKEDVKDEESPAVKRVKSTEDEPAAVAIDAGDKPAEDNPEVEVGTVDVSGKAPETEYSPGAGDDDD